jgi:2-keto-4-pentenoate hydratase
VSAPDAAAAEILAAYDSGRQIPRLSDADPALDEPAAYEIASRVRALRERRGERPVGRKIGFTNRSTWSTYGVDAPIWGHMYDSTVHYADDGEIALDVGHLAEPRIEPEIQLHFARTPPVTDDEEAILQCVDWIAHGFEIVHSLFAGWKFKGVDAIAGLGVHGALVVGPRVAVTDPASCAAELRAFEVVLSRNGQEQARGVGANVLGSPVLAFAHLNRVLAKRPESAPVEAGELVTTGTLTELFPVVSGETWSTVLSGTSLSGVTLTFV